MESHGVTAPRIVNFHTATTQSKPARDVLDAHPCECGNHVFAFPFDEEHAAWKDLRASRIRHLLEERGLIPPEPRRGPHVILVSPEDADLLKSARWRVWPTKNGARHRYLVARKVRGMPLAKLIRPSTPECPVLVFANSDGTDLRRENLRATTMREVVRETAARRRQAHERLRT